MRAPHDSSTSSSEPARRTDGLRRVLSLALPAVLVAGTLVGLAWSGRDWLRRGLTQRVALETHLLPRIEGWRARRSKGGPPGAVLFGDSLTICADGAGLAVLVGRRLEAAGQPYDVLSVTNPAFRPLNAYYLLDTVLAGRPGLAIVEVNLRGLAEVTAEPSFRFAPLSRHLSLRRALRVREALAADDLGILDPALYRLEDRLDLLWVADGVREVGRSAFETAGRWLNAALDLEDPAVILRIVNAYPARRDEGVRRQVEAEYTVDPGARPQTRVMHALLAELRAAGVRTLFYVSPVHVDYLRELGLEEGDLALAHRVEALRRAVGATPAEWLDLHATERAAGFHDIWNHLHRPACERVAAAIAGRVSAP